MAFAMKRPSSTLADMNITPLVDVMLVLLVIFMIAAPALSQSLAVTLPQLTPPIQPALTPRVLRLDAGDVATLDGRSMARSELARELGQMALLESSRVLKVEIDPDVDYQSASSALALVRNAGIEHLQLSGM